MGSVKVKPASIGFLVLLVLFLIYVNRGTKKEHGGSDYVSMRDLLVAAIEVAHRGGREVKRIREQANIGEKSKGGIKNPVTDGDMLSHRQMYNGLLKAFPKLHVISEEEDPEAVDIETIETISLSNPEVSSVIPDSADVSVPTANIDVWIDPLDATQEYTENLLQYVTTMVCVAMNGLPILGVIHKPFTNETAWGWLGTKFVSNSVKKYLASYEEERKGYGGLERSKMIVSRSHAGKVHDIAEHTLGKDIIVTPAGGAGYKSLEVLKGNQDAYVHTGLIKKWDICAPAALLGVAGGKLTSLNGSGISFSGKPLEVKQKAGVLATMHDHAAYVEKLAETAELMNS